MPGRGGRLQPGHERVPEQRPDRHRPTARGELAADQRGEHVDRLARLVLEPTPLPRPSQLLEVHELVRHVPGEQFVTGLAVQQHGHVGLGEPHDAPLRVRGRGHDRLVLVPDHPVDLGDPLGRRRLDERRCGAGVGEHGVDVLALVDRVTGVHDAERAQLVAQAGGVGGVLAEQLRRGARDRRGVDTARQARPDRNLGDEPALDRPGPQLPEPVGVVGVGRVQLGAPVGAGPHPVGVVDLPRGRRHLADAGERRLGSVVVESVEQVVVEPLRVGFGLQVGRGEQRLDLTREQRAAVGLGHVERLDAVVVTGEHELRFVAAQVGDRQAPHAVEPCEAVRAPGGVGGEHHLGVAVGPELPVVDELGPQLPVVVDLAVVDDLQVRGPERLVPSGDVDDRQSPVTQAQAFVGEGAVVVGAAVLDQVEHLRQQRVVRCPGEPGDPTHRCPTLPVGRASPGHPHAGREPGGREHRSSARTASVDRPGPGSGLGARTQSPSAERSASTRSVRSQVKPSPVRPKWPYAAV